MSDGFRKLVAPALVLLSLAGCVSLPARKPSVPADDALLAEQAAREHALASTHAWSLQAKLGISSEHDGGSGTLSWTERTDGYEFLMRLPVTGKSFRLSGDATGATLDGLDQGSMRGASAEALMFKALGWQLPLSDLRAWVLGMRAGSGPAQLSFGADRLPAVLQQDGWRVEYRAWDTTRQPALPTKVFAEKPPYKVRLSIESWQLP